MSDAREIRRRILASRAQEARGAKAHGGRVTPGSGNGGKKGDVRTPTTVVEYKRTDKRQISVRSDDLEKVFQEALSVGRRPVFGIEVGGKNYVIMLEGDYLELVEGAED